MKLLKHLFPTLVAGVVLLSTPALSAADTTADKAPAVAEKGKADKPSNENLTPEERAKRRKEAAEKRAAQLKELRAKKDAGTLTDAEKSQLERMEKQAERAKNGRRNRGQGGEGSPKKGKKGGGDKPAA
ncbi:MAG: hypothetical protein RLZZ341_2187 [Pseudomonadota bacterium]|jgi:hypothetical protein